MEMILLGATGLLLIAASTWFRLHRQGSTRAGAGALHCSGVLSLGDRGSAYTLQCEHERFLVIRTPTSVVVTPLQARAVESPSVSAP